MKISVRLFSTLKPYSPNESGKDDLELDQGSRIGDLIRILHIPDKAGRVILVNGRVAGEGRKLAEGDEVVLFPPIEGG